MRVDRHFSRSGVFRWSLLAFVSGCFLTSFLPDSFLAGQGEVFFYLAMALLPLAYWFGLNRLAGVIIFCSAFLVLASWRYSLAMPALAPEKIYLNGVQNISTNGRICADPDIKNGRQELVVCLKSFYINKREIRTKNKTLIYAPKYPAWEYGQKLKINGQFKNLLLSNNLDNYQQRLIEQNIYTIFFYPEIEEIRNRENILDYWWSSATTIKTEVESINAKSLGLDESALANSIILGTKKDLSAKLKDDFARWGLTHIMAVSGFNIEIVSFIFFTFFLAIGLHRRWASFLALFFLFFYVTLVGAPASALRALVMAFLLIWAGLAGRLANLANSLLVTAFILLLINPKMIRYDLGFQLSFSACLGIIFIYPFLKKKILDNFDFDENKKKPQFWPWLIKISLDLILVTFSAQLAVMPVIIASGLKNPLIMVSIFGNFLILWIIPFLTIAILLAVLLTWLIPAGYLWWFFLVKLGLDYILLVVNWKI